MGAGRVAAARDRRPRAAAAGCSSGSTSSTEAEQAMYAAVSSPVMTAARSAPAGNKMVGTAADGLRLAVTGPLGDRARRLLPPRPA